MKIIGVDPGDSGAISVLEGDLVHHCRLDLTERDVCDFLVGHKGTPSFAYLERVHSFPGQGVSSSFKFGVSYGFLRGLLIGLQIPFEEVSPHKWQLALGCARPAGQPKESQTDHKNRTKSRAQQLFPGIKVTHAIADSLLLAEFGRRLRTGELNNPSHPTV